MYMCVCCCTWIWKVTCEALILPWSYNKRSQSCFVEIRVGVEETFERTLTKVWFKKNNTTNVKGIAWQTSSEIVREKNDLKDKAKTGVFERN